MIVAKRTDVSFVPDPERHTLGYAKRAEAASAYINTMSRTHEQCVIADTAAEAAVELAARLRAQFRTYDNENDLPAPGLDFGDFSFGVRYSQVIDSIFTWPPLYGSGHQYTAADTAEDM